MKVLKLYKFQKKIKVMFLLSKTYQTHFDNGNSILWHGTANRWGTNWIRSFNILNFDFTEPELYFRANRHGLDSNPARRTRRKLQIYFGRLRLEPSGISWQIQVGQIYSKNLVKSCNKVLIFFDALNDSSFLIYRL